MALVLCTGLSEPLLQTRRFMLEIAGHKVVTALGEEAVRAVCNIHSFDVAVIGQARTRVRKRHVFEFVKKYSPNTKVLEIYRPYNGRSLAEADDWLESPTLNPADLIARVDALARNDER